MTEDLYWVGASDRRLALFESVYPIPRGVSYNAYVLLDEKTVLLDTVDQSVAGQFFENLTHVLGGRPLDYIVVHQTGCMKQFQRNCRMKGGRSHSPIKACYQQDENRTHHLSTALAYMSYYAIKQCIRTGKRTIIKFFESLKFAFNRCSDNRDAVHSCTI